MNMELDFDLKSAVVVVVHVVVC